MKNNLRSTKFTFFSVPLGESFFERQFKIAHKIEVAKIILLKVSSNNYVNNFFKESKEIACRQHRPNHEFIFDRMNEEFHKLCKNSLRIKFYYLLKKIKFHFKYSKIYKIKKCKNKDLDIQYDISL